MNLETRNVHLDHGWFMLDLGPVNVVYMDERVTDASYDRYIGCLRDDLASIAGTRRGVLYDVPDMKALSGERRAEVAEVLNEFRSTLASVNAAYTLVTPSRVVRGVVQMVFWLAPPPYPHRVVGTVPDAAEYLASKLPDLNADRWVHTYERTRGDLLGRMQQAAM